MAEVQFPEDYGKLLSLVRVNDGFASQLPPRLRLVTYQAPAETRRRHLRSAFDEDDSPSRSRCHRYIRTAPQIPARKSTGHMSICGTEIKKLSWAMYWGKLARESEVVLAGGRGPAAARQRRGPARLRRGPAAATARQRLRVSGVFCSWRLQFLMVGERRVGERRSRSRMSDSGGAD